MENHGNHVIANDESAINIPAVAAAHVTKRYIAQAPDEISLEVNIIQYPSRFMCTYYCN